MITNKSPEQYTLAEITNKFLDTYQIEDTTDNFRAVRTKIVRQLEELNLYQKFMTTQNKQRMVLVPYDIVRDIESQIRLYLLKKSSMSDEEKAKYIHYLENWKPIVREFKEKHSTHSHPPVIQPPVNKISQQELDSAMIQALFQVFYTPIDTEKWIADKKTLAKHDGKFNLEFLKALERNANPHLHYTKRRQDSDVLFI